MRRVLRKIRDFDPFDTLTGAVLMCIALGLLVGFMLPTFPRLFGWGW